MSLFQPMAYDILDFAMKLKCDGMKLLVTAFEPFGEDAVNSSEETLRMIPERIDGARIISVCLPVVFGKSVDMLRDVVERERPDAVLCLGQAGGSTELTPERVAINLEDASLPDNAGQQPSDAVIFPDGPAAFFSTLPVRKMTDAIREEGLPARMSNSAGTFVCNQLMYGLLYYLEREFPGVPGGFLHLPYLKEQADAHPGSFGLSREELAKGVMAAIRAVIAADLPQKSF